MAEARFGLFSIGRADATGVSELRAVLDDPAQPEDYRKAVLGEAPRVGVEAAVRLGWDRWLGERSAFIGMNEFGASAPGEALFAHFGITPEKVAEAARSLL